MCGEGVEPEAVGDLIEIDGVQPAQPGAGHHQCVGSAAPRQVY